MISAAQTAKIKAIAYKCAIYSLALFLLGIAQVTFFSKITLFSATPDLLLGSIALLCIKEDHKVTSICAIVSGVFYCAFGGIQYPVYIIFSFLCGYLAWIIAGRVFGKSYPSYLALCALIFGAKGIFNFFYSVLFSSSFALIRTVVSIVIPEFVSSMIFCSLSYLLFNTLHKLLNRKSRKRKESLKNEL